MKLRKLIDILEKAATVCEDGGQKCEVNFVADDGTPLEIKELVGEGTTTVAFERGDLSLFPGWQETLKFVLQLKSERGCPIASHASDCDCDGAGGDR